MATVVEEIEAVLFAQVLELELTGAPDIAMPNVAFKPVVGHPYVRVMHFPNRNTRLFIKGSAPHLHQGILQFTIVSPLNVGPAIATQLAGEIAEQFPADLDLFDGDLRVRIQQAPDIIPADKGDVSWDARVDVLYEALT